MRTDAQVEYERRLARTLAAAVSYDQLQQMNRDGLISSYTWRTLLPVLELADFHKL